MYLTIEQLKQKAASDKIPFDILLMNEYNIVRDDAIRYAEVKEQNDFLKKLIIKEENKDGK